MSEIEKIIEHLTKDVEALTAEIKVWGGNFSADPVYALEWADGIFAKVAMHRVKGIVLAWAQRAKTKDQAQDCVQSLCEHAKSEALRLTRLQAKTSSRSHDHLNAEIAIAWAKVADWLGRPIL